MSKWPSFDLLCGPCPPATEIMANGGLVCRDSYLGPRMGYATSIYVYGNAHYLVRLQSANAWIVRLVSVEDWCGPPPRVIWDEAWRCTRCDKPKAQHSGSPCHNGWWIQATGRR